MTILHTLGVVYPEFKHNYIKTSNISDPNICDPSDHI